VPSINLSDVISGITIVELALLSHSASVLYRFVRSNLVCFSGFPYL